MKLRRKLRLEELFNLEYDLYVRVGKEQRMVKLANTSLLIGSNTHSRILPKAVEASRRKFFEAKMSYSWRQRSASFVRHGTLFNVYPF